MGIRGWKGPKFSWHLSYGWGKTPEKTSVRLAGHGIWTRDLPKASLVRYHEATSLGFINLCLVFQITFFHVYNLILSVQTAWTRVSNSVTFFILQDNLAYDII